MKSEVGVYIYGFTYLKRLIAEQVSFGYLNY
jgi:hypothetical protein